MSDESHDRLQRVFLRACRLDLNARAEYLDEACGQDRGFRHKVEQLIAMDSEVEAESGGIFDSKQINVGLHVLASAMAEHGDFEEPEAPLPDRIGNYRVLGVLGHGGMGVVYEAEQISPRRRVALKVVRPSMITRNLLQRFRHESQVLGLLRHPGIAQIYEAGTADTGGARQPFFAMELVEGETILKHAETHGLSTPARLDLLARLCDIIHYAHQKGVIHRDLKPGNILVTEDARSSAAERPASGTGAESQLKVLDFGVARITDIDLQTVTVRTNIGQLVGTVPYMSPEQASGDPDRIDIRSDVYALGLIACELLSGKLPYDVRDKMVHEAVRIIQEEDPSSLSTANPALRGEIETIVFKALEKDKDRRYQSAAEFAADIRRYLRDEPIEARPASAWYQARKFARRNRSLVAGALATLTVSLVGTAVASRYAVVASRYAASDSARADAMERASYISGIAAAMSAIEQHDPSTAEAYLDRTPERHRGWEHEYLRARLNARLTEWTAPELIDTPLRIDRDANEMSAVLRGLSRCTWTLEGGPPIRSEPLRPDLETSLNTMYAVTMHSQTGRYIARDPSMNFVTASRDSDTPPKVIHVSNSRFASVLAWDDSGSRAVLVDDSTMLWDGREMRVVAEKPAGRASFSHSGDRLCLTRGELVFLVDTETGDTLLSRAFNEQFTSLSFSPDDRLIIATGFYRSAILLEADTLDVIARLGGHQDSVVSSAWSEDGARLVTASLDNTLRIWDTNTHALLAVHRFDVGKETFAVTVSGNDIFVAGEGIQRFPLGDASVLRGHRSYVYNLAFSPDGRTLASVGFLESELRLWDVESRSLRASLPAPKTYSKTHDTDAAPNVEFSSDSSRLVVNNSKDTWNWDLQSLAPLPVIEDEDPFEEFLLTLGRRQLARYSPFVVLGPEEGLAAIDLIDSQFVAAATSISISPDGTRIAIAQIDGGVSVYVDRTSVPIGVLVGHSGIVYCVAFSSDGERIATGGNDNTVRIWDAKTFEQLLVLRGHTSYVKDIVFSPDGTIIASASGDRTIRLWDTSRR